MPPDTIQQHICCKNIDRDVIIPLQSVRDASLRLEEIHSPWAWYRRLQNGPPPRDILHVHMYAKIYSLRNGQCY